MRIRTFVPALLLAVSLFPVAAQPRKAAEITITEASGKQSLLSAYRGKVIALAFILTTCPHCQAECGLLSKLNTELGPRGFQPVAIAFNDNANMLIKSFVENFHPNFPVGWTTRDEAKKYLGYDDKTQWFVPQIVLIDRKGMVVEQSIAKGSEELQKEETLRPKIEALLGAKTVSKKAGL